MLHTVASEYNMRSSLAEVFPNFLKFIIAIMCI